MLKAGCLLLFIYQDKMLVFIRSSIQINDMIMNNSLYTAPPSGFYKNYFSNKWLINEWYSTLIQCRGSRVIKIIIIMISWWNKRFSANNLILLTSAFGLGHKILLPQFTTFTGNNDLFLSALRASRNKRIIFASNLLFHHSIIMTFA